MPTDRPIPGRRPRVVIIGGGFAGIAAAKKLRRAPVDVLIVDRTNHHVFQPLLYQAATGTLAVSDIIAPIRWLVRKQSNTEVLMGEVTRIDVPGGTIELQGGDGGIRTEPFDYLIMAAGARHAYFGHDEWEALAPGLKSLEDAQEIRNRFLLSFERAEWCSGCAEREAWQTIVIVGGGPTGVELAGIMVEIARKAFRPEFRAVDTRKTRVVLVEGTSRLLSTYSEQVSERAKRDLEELGVEVRLGAQVTGLDADGVSLGEERINAKTVIWAAGNRASKLSSMLGVEVDRNGRVPVAADLSIEPAPNVFVVGDQAAVEQADGNLVPGVAPAAMQMGQHAAENVIRDLRRQKRRPFRYRNKGDMATIGRNRAVAVFRHGEVEVFGTLAWLLWLFVHIMYLAGFRNRLSVLLQWGFAYFTWQRGARLILRKHERGRGARNSE